MKETPGYYTTGDAGFYNEKGYLHIMTRVDDVINTCGHRLSTGRFEEVINDHEIVIESAVVGIEDVIKGECPIAYIILKTGAKYEHKKLLGEINLKIRQEIGPIAKLEELFVV